MEKLMSARGGKIFFVSAALVLIAAGCNSSEQPGAPVPVSQTTQKAAAQTPVQTPVTATAPASQPTPAPATAPKTTPTPTPAPAPKTVKPVAPQVKPVLMVGSSASLGQYLEAGDSMTLYYYTNDTPLTSNCSGACAANWPPYVLPAGTQLAVTQGIHGKLGLISRADGSMQLTYNNMPLYFWVKDAKAGDITGNQVNGFFVAKP